MDALPSEPAGEADPAEIRSLRPNQARWHAAVARSALPSSPRWNAWPAAAAVMGLAGAASLAALAAARPDLGDFGPAVLAAALAAACVPPALCLRFAAAAPTLPADGASAGRTAELDARERLPADQVAAARREASEPRPKPAGGLSDGGAVLKMRRHARIRPSHLRTVIATGDGRRLNARIIDVSQSGVAIEGNFPGLWIGCMVTVGSRRAKAVRALPRGMAFEFSTPVPAEALTVDFVL